MFNKKHSRIKQYKKVKTEIKCITIVYVAAADNNDRALHNDVTVHCY